MINQKALYRLKLLILSVFLYSSKSIGQIIVEPIGYAYSTEIGSYELIFQSSSESAPSMGRFLGLRVDRLEIEPMKIELNINQNFQLNSLKVMAFDSDNSLISEAPFNIEIEAPNNLIEIITTATNSPIIRAANAGVGRLWITASSPSSNGENYKIPLIIAVNSNKELPQPPLLY
ncbi:MAG: hypothetical protein CBC38_01525 [Gammaproteobacteria bacterium TMED78]|nr:MAG: hypothetical protein CBC38_01525 [Gammaproteobacteria bacterium TMED78]|tara:strand:+ start:14420 stop:14944 length:525 start_codon:yes stop_codon:yes gene_type:complete